MTYLEKANLWKNNANLNADLKKIQRGAKAKCFGASFNICLPCVTKCKEITPFLQFCIYKILYIYIRNIYKPKPTKTKLISLKHIHHTH